jgi:hypothetical protein
MQIFEDDDRYGPPTRTETAFLIAFAVVIALGLLVVWLWPEAAIGATLDTDLPAIAIITPVSGSPRTIEVTNGQCLKFQAYLAQNDLYIEDFDLPRQQAIKVECHCVSIDPTPES